MGDGGRKEAKEGGERGGEGGRLVLIHVRPVLAYSPSIKDGRRPCLSTRSEQRPTCGRVLLLHQRLMSVYNALL